VTLRRGRGAMGPESGQLVLGLVLIIGRRSPQRTGEVAVSVAPPGPPFPYKTMTRPVMQRGNSSPPTVL
jgi:hypothetical protein